jgi:hypothetical protein
MMSCETEIKTKSLFLFLFHLMGMFDVDTESQFLKKEKWNGDKSKAYMYPVP